MVEMLLYLHMHLFKCAGISAHEHFLKYKKDGNPSRSNLSFFPSVLIFFFLLCLLSVNTDFPEMLNHLGNDKEEF